MTKRKKPFLTPWRVVLSIVLLLIIFSLGTWLLLSGKNIAVLNPQGIIAAQQKDLIIFTLLLSLVVVIPVFVMLGVFAWRYREGNHRATYTPDVEGNKVLEAIWWGIPIVIIGILSVVTWVSSHQLDPYKPIVSNSKPLKVQVIALQWKWLFLYPEYGLASMNELKIPTGVPVNFDITADAPMSALWIPNLGTQTYAMSGMNSKLSLRADKSGEYRGSNSNINGEGYSEMDFKAIAIPKDEFEQWADNTARTSDEGERHLDWDQYEILVKPSKNNSVSYYHLHDVRLYNKVMQKYMPSNHGASNIEGGGH